MEYYIADGVWERLYYFLRQEKGLHRHKPGTLRRFIEAVCYIARSGCQWRLLPSHYGCWRGVHRRFKRWSEAGVWERMLSHVSDADREYVMIDATIVRAHACAAGYKKDYQEQECLGRSKGGFTPKIHALGNPLKHLDVQSRHLMVRIFYHPCRRSYGPSFTWERHHDRGGPSSNTK